MPDASRRAVLALAAGAMVWPVIGRAQPVSTVEGRAFGTTWRVAAPPHMRPERLRPALDALFARTDAQMSPWRSDSALSTFNAAGAGDFAVPNALATVAGSALGLAAQSGGAFDPTVGPAVAHWGFGPIRDGQQGWQSLTVEGSRIGKRDGITLDLCGIAKGWALDRALELLRTAGIDSALVDLGGELAAIGHHPEGRDWRVAVEDPAGGPPMAALRLVEGLAVATSGLAAQGFRHGDRVYSHIIDPRSGEPVDGLLRSVTVLASTAMRADGWATALCAADRDGPSLARAQGIDALFLFEDGAGLRQVRTGTIGEVLL